MTVSNASASPPSRRAFRGAVLHFLDDPARCDDEARAYQYFDDGLLVVRNGLVEQVGEARAMLPALGEEVPLIDYSPERYAASVAELLRRA